MYTLPITLKQHTPIIHFQAEQDGATLRASEVKPKLDRFIAEILLSLNNSFNKHESAIDKIKIAINDKRSLYQVSILDVEKPEFYLPLAININQYKFNDVQNHFLQHKQIDISLLSPTPYFGNQDKIANNQFEEIRLGLFSNNPIKARINTPDKEIYDLLYEAVPYFFISHCFGTRQSKGFGSFTVSHINEKEVKDVDKLIRTFYAYKSTRPYSISKIFEFIQTSYQLLKSGHNFPNYQKSNLFEYFIRNNKPPLRWEKRYLKQQINLNKIDQKELYFTKLQPIDIEDFNKKYYNDLYDKQPNEYKFVRALLGLAEQYEFLVLGENGYADKNFRYVTTMTHADKIIDRFKSPITFKVIDQLVYIRFDATYKQLLGKEFEFILKLKGSNTASKSLGKLKVPGDFDLSAFLNKYLPHQDWKKL